MFSLNKDNSEIKFWNWFEKNHQMFEHLESNRGKSVKLFYKKLQAVNKDLVFEISYNDQNQKELIISADGCLDLFICVTALVDKAPKIEGWKITAFRPRMGADFNIILNEEEFDTKNIYFSPIIEDDHLDLILYIPDAENKASETMTNLCFILLDTALGEYDAVTKVRYVDYLPLPADAEAEGLFPFEELSGYFDNLYYNKN